LDLALNIEESMSEVRLKLKRTGKGNSQESLVLFETLFETWCLDPITAISLSLLSQQYAVTMLIIKILSFAHLDVPMLLQLSQLVKLIDMPHYATMRMQLLEPEEHPDLIWAWKGLLMLLPQGKAFESLKLVNRIFFNGFREWSVQICWGSLRIGKMGLGG
jgi:vacuole morphology and inheritance protein 14